jgi:signal transduction histidine kinase
MADMVSGVLHNVKNALAPVLIDIESLEKRASRIRSGKILEAAKGLGDLALPEERRRDLSEYVALSCASIEAQAREFEETLALMKTKVDLIDKVLSEHNKFSGAERPLESIKVEELIQDSLALVRQDYLDKIAVAVEPAPAEIGKVTTQRIVVIQIIANLIMNALESIIRAENPHGRVVISAQAGAAGKIHLKIKDNGAGISQERLTLIFQRGVSSKQGSFGLGLHWCANAAASLDGQLYAESEGIGKGACLNLVL